MWPSAPLLQKQFHFQRWVRSSLGSSTFLINVVFTSPFSLKEDLVKNFKNVHIHASLESGGPAAEYIRTGMNWEKWKDNFVKIAIDKKSFLYLFGTELDFSDGLNGKGFQFINPNASRTCGCGESFAI